MPSRLIREGILESERVDLLSCAAEVFYRRAMSKADDYGRFYAKPELLIAALYPLRTLKVTAAEIDGWLQECSDAGLMRLYQVDGKPLLEILDFRQQVRSQPKFPGPPPLTGASQPSCAAIATQMPSNCAASAHLVGFEFVSVSGAKRPVNAGDAQASLDAFETLWQAYPRRAGGNPKRMALRAWQARIAAGVSADEMLAGVGRYAAFVRAEGKEGTPFVKQAATFLGPDEHFREPWALPGSEAPQGRGIDHGRVV